MNCLFIGGDERMIYAAEHLASEGNRVSAFAMDKAPLSRKVCKTAELSAAECAVFPVPAETGEGALNAPFAETAFNTVGIMEALPRGTLICGGKISPRMKAAAQRLGLTLSDYLTRPELTVGNAAVTAEGAIALLMQRTDCALFGKSALVAGYGRIGKILTDRLRGLGVKVTVMSRSPESRAMAKALGCSAVPPGAAPPVDLVVNTAPGRLLTELERLPRSCILLELASAPGGIDKDEAQRLGLRYLSAPGLPGKYAPETAGRFIAEEIKNIVKEQNNA